MAFLACSHDIDTVGSDVGVAVGVGAGVGVGSAVDVGVDPGSNPPVTPMATITAMAATRMIINTGMIFIAFPFQIAGCRSSSSAFRW